MRQRFAHFILACLLLAAGIPAQAQQDRVAGRPDPQFRVLEVRGIAYVTRPGSQGFQQVSLSTKDFELASKDEVQTGINGYVRIGLQDGSQVEILSNSHVQLGDPKPSLMRLLDIFLGHVRVVIEHLSGKPNPYSFSTPTAVLGVRGTIFDVAVDQSTATIVAVSDGAVRVENSRYPGRGGVTVKKGYRTIVRPQELPSKPERFTGNGTDPSGMAMKHGKSMDDQSGGMMSGSQSGMQPGSGSMGSQTGGTMGSPGGGSMPGGQQGGGMSGMGRHR